MIANVVDRNRSTVQANAFTVENNGNTVFIGQIDRIVFVEIVIELVFKGNRTFGQFDAALDAFWIDGLAVFTDTCHEDLVGVGM